MPQGDPVYIEVMQKWRENMKDERQITQTSENYQSIANSVTTEQLVNAALRVELDLIQTHLQRLEQAIEELIRKLDNDG